MGSLDHWQPVCTARALRRMPRRVEIDGQGLVLFRTESGAVGALDDRCPHRHTRLSGGQVVHGRIQCPYHGWQFGIDGQGTCPGTPAQQVSTRAYDVHLAQGLIWVKSTESTAEFPEFDVAGFHALGVIHRRVQAPLELVLDNTCEMEHAPLVHRVFGFELDQMADVRLEVTADEASVRVVNVGPARIPDPLTRIMLGISREHDFVDEWVTRFSPVYSVFQHWWRHRETHQEARIRTRLYLFYVPVNSHETNLWLIGFVKSRWPGPRGGMRLFSWLVKHHLRSELDRDIRVLRKLDHQGVEVTGMKLSRFDRVMLLNREKLQQVYRGSSQARAATTETTHHG